MEKMSFPEVAFGNSTGMPVVLLSTLAPSLVVEGRAPENRSREVFLLRMERGWHGME